MTYWQRWERASAPAIVGLIALAYIPAATFTWWTVSRSGVGEAFDATAGISVVVFLSLPRRRWPLAIVSIMLAQLASGLIDGREFDGTVMVGFGIASVVEGIVATLAYNQLARRQSGASDLPDLTRRKSLGRFMFAACLVGAASGAAVDSLTLWRSGMFSADDALYARQFAAHALGIVIVAPLLLAWTSPAERRSWRSPLALIIPVVLTCGIAISLQLDNIPALSVLFAGLIVAGAFFGIRTVALSGAGMAVAMAIAIIGRAYDPIAGMTPIALVSLSKVEFLMFAMSAYLVAAQVSEQQIAADTAAEHMTTVSQLQQLLLPPIAMNGSGYAVRGTYDPAQRRVGIGGDWYLARVAVNGHLVFAVGDIVGHDFSAARSMAAVRSSLVLEAALRPNASDLLEKLDAYSTAEPSIRFSTAWVGVYDPANRTLDYACAGHPPPLLVANDRVVRLDRANTALVGIPQQGRRSTTTFIPPGAAIVLYTDGLVERRSAGVEPGIERLEAAILRDGAHPDSLLATMLHDSDREDDAAVAVIDFDQIESDPDHTDPRLEMPRASARAR